MKKIIMILLILCVICIGCGKKDKKEESVDEPVLVIEEQEEENDENQEININIPGETTTIETNNTSNADEPTKTQTTTESKKDDNQSTNVINPGNNSSNPVSQLNSAFDRLKTLASNAYGSAKDWYEDNDVPGTVHSYIYDLDEEKLDNLKDNVFGLYDENLGELTTTLVGEETYNHYKDEISMTYDEYSKIILMCYAMDDNGYYTDPETGEQIYLGDDCPVNGNQIRTSADEFEAASVIGKVEMIQQLLEDMGIL